MKRKLERVEGQADGRSEGIGPRNPGCSGGNRSFMQLDRQTKECFVNGLSNRKMRRVWDKSRTNLIIQLQVVHLDITAPNLRVDLVNIQLTRLQQMSQGLLEHKGDESALNAGWEREVD
jgi:hypothetical protein